MTFVQRIALVVGLIFLAAGAAATFLPTSPGGASCGTWASPAWPEDETRELVGDALDSAESSAELGSWSEDIADDMNGLAASAWRAYTLCSDALSTRRTVTIVLLSLSVIAPAAALFIGANHRRRPE